ncbi:MAG: CPBP family intramembrane glutamic endopeptidase [Eubacteriales bacterium]
MENMDMEMNKSKVPLWVKLYRSISPFLYYHVITLVVQVPIAVYYMYKALEYAGSNEELYMGYYTQSITDNTMLILAVAALTNLPVMILLMKYDRKKIQVWEEWPHIVNQSPGKVIRLLLFAIAYCISLNNIITISGLATLFPEFEEIAENIYSSTIFVQILVVGILVPIVEELLFRGLLYRRMRYYSNVTVAIVISSAIFGVYHGNVVQAIYAGIMGAAMAYIYEKYRSILWPILFHMIANCTSVCLSSTDIGLTLMGNTITFLVGTLVATVTAGICLWQIRKEIC